MTQRVVWSVLALVILTAQAHGESLRFCSDGFDQPATMEFSEDYSDLTLTIGNDVAKYTLGEAEGPHERQALIYDSDASKSIGNTTAKAALGEYPLLPIMLYEDRVFWPCEARK